MLKGVGMEKVEKEWREDGILDVELKMEGYDRGESVGNIVEKKVWEWEKVYGGDVWEGR